MSIFIRRIETIYDGMELEEKKLLASALTVKLMEDGLLHIPEETMVSMTGSGPAKVSKPKGTWKGRKPFWCKTLTSFEGGAKGTDCIVGEYFFDVKDAVNSGGYYVIGFRAEPKKYAVMVRDDGSNIAVGHDGRDHVFEDSDILGEFNSFKLLKEYMKLMDF